MNRLMPFTLFCAAILFAQPLVRADSNASRTGRTLTTQFTYKATVPDIPAGSKSLNLWIPVPSNSPLQTVRDIKVDAPAAHQVNRENKYGNRMIYVHLDNPTAPVAVSVSFVVDRKEAAVLDGGTATDAASLARGNGAVDKYLLPDNRVPTGGKYAALAEEAAAGKATSLDKVRAIYENVVANMQYDYRKESPKYAQGDVPFVCDYKKGNCSDLHSYIISLARSLKIPAYIEYGFPLTGVPVPDAMPKEGAIAGYHCWTWFYDQDHGWVPLDASDGRRWLDAKKPEVKERLFGNLVLERSAVAFSRGRDITLVPAQKAGPLNDFIYPYAEADGASVKPAYEVKYSVISGANVASAAPAPQQGGDLQKQIDELRKIVMDQAKEIAELKGAKKEKAPAPAPPVTVASGEKVGFYGFIRLDAIHDSSQANNAQIPFFINSPSNANVAGHGNGQLTLHPRLSRLGWNFAAPNANPNDTKVTGKFEIDFQNGQGTTTESRPLPRIRHAYLQLQRGASSWLFGQTWDLISPLFPSPNDDTLMWNAGNLGDRRPQIRYTNELPNRPFSAAIALGLTGALDAKDLDANGVRDGEDSSLPNVQGRIAWKAKKTTVGLWGNHAWETETKPVVGRREFHSYSVGMDLQQGLTGKLDLKGELFLGSNLSDFRGGINQGVTAATGDQVRTHGGWLELGFQRTPSHRIAVGYTEDNPVDSDIPVGGRLKNYSIYLHNRFKLSGNIEIGANYLYWLTSWKGLATGIDHRINAFIQHNF